MAFQKHYLIRIVGELGPATVRTEKFVTSVRVAMYDTGALGLYVGDLVDIPDPRDYLINQVIPAVRALVASPGLFSQVVHVTEVQCNQVGSDGKYTDPNNVHFVGSVDFPGGEISGTGGTVPPFQTALVLSLKTRIARGLASHGRMYWPCPATLPQTSGRINDATRDEYAAAFQTFLNSLNHTISGGLAGRISAVVASRGKKLTPAIPPSTPATYGAGAMERVTRLAVGEVLDTMQSRRRSLVENYVEMGVTQ